MIQFNLLPDVKKQYVRAKRTKRLILSASTLATIGAVGVTVLMFTFVRVAQKKHISDLTNDISRVTNEIQSTDNLNNILTVQNQLSLLPELHTSKPETSRVFDYVSFVSPKSVLLSRVDLNTELTKLEISGTADSLAIVNKLVDNVKAVTYAVAGSSDETQTFSEISTKLSGGNEGATFTISMTYDPIIFSNSQDVILRLGAQPSSSPAGEGN